MVDWLFIVSSTELERYLYLKHEYADEAREVIFDRRVGQRRRNQTPVPANRRQLERRHHDITAELQSIGWTLVTRCVDERHVVSFEPMVRWLIQLRLEDGRLPRGRITDRTENAGDGRRCDGCGAVISAVETAVTGVSEEDCRDIRLHVACFKIWDTERLAKCEASPVMLLDREVAMTLGPARGELDSFLHRREERGRFYCGACLVQQLTQRGARKLTDAHWTEAVADAFQHPGVLQVRSDQPCEACQKSRPSIGALQAVRQ